MEKVIIMDQSEKSVQDFKENKYREVRLLIEKDFPGSKGKNLLSFLSIIFDSFTDFHFLRGLSANDLNQMVLNYHRFFMEDLKPLDKNFRGLPPVSIRIFNPSDDPDYAQVAKDLEMETTLLQVHTMDGPFIFESIRNYLKKKGYRVYNVIHPVVPVIREKGKTIQIGAISQKGEKETFLNIFMEKIVNPNNRESILVEVRYVLKSLFLAINDFQNMVGVVEDLIKDKKKAKKPSESGDTKGEMEEQTKFLEWLNDNNFIFMGTQNYGIGKKGKAQVLIPDESSKLGVFRDMGLMSTVFPGQVEEFEERLNNSWDQAPTISIEYFNTCASVIYHFDPINIIVVKRLDNKGKTVSATMLFGRFSRGSIFQKSSNVAILRGKIQNLLGTTRKKYSSHFTREFLTVFNQIPKRELLYLELDELRDLIEMIISVQSDENAQVFVQTDSQNCHISLFVIISRTKYSRDVREKVKDLLVRNYKCPMTRWETIDCFSNTVMVYYLDTRKGEKFTMDVGMLKSNVQDIISTWDDRLTRSLVREYGDRQGFILYNKYKKPFSDFYKEITNIENALFDVRNLEAMEKDREVRINIYSANNNGEVEIKLYSDSEIDLMTIIPTAQNIGLYISSEQVVPLCLSKGGMTYIHIFKVTGDKDSLQNLLERRSLVSEILIKIMEGETVNDCLSHLVLKAGFNWKTVELVRAVKSYLLQIDSTFSPNTIDDVLIKFTDITKKMIVYFETKFRLENNGKSVAKREKPLDTSEQIFFDSLVQVSSLLEDQIFREMFDIFKNMTRTNFYKSPSINYISFKIDCRKMAKMPSPRPFFEIYVHSPQLEGVHLRGGKVARGGLRWSDRYDDFRTEILGLMKTQMVKNAVIVPVGSKGGFVLKTRDFKDRKEMDSYVKKQYQTFISGLLDITDNIESGETVPPHKVVVYDDPDPYLVVAADKGTAKLSDAANEISSKYGFWLGDAFASGGAIGYDHKKEGITARGAWECVKRHFREKNIDIQQESIRVAGIGDMSGDVFGNGMLLSEKIKLVAAFNHIHIFLDPDPDPAKSWQERKRLFEKPRLTWMDYSPKLISKGGGVFSRSSKSIALSAEAKKMLGITNDKVNGEELIRSILTMEVDLLWNGGIGTYVKASSESDLDVGDRGNDRVRVNARDLKAKVIGEGGNLGVTQLARIEAGKKGIACNTDAIDNSGGVDMSDHEVNLKILLGSLLENGEIKTREERNELFMRVTDEVARLVLWDNYLQSAAISMDRIRSAKKIEPLLDVIDLLSELKILNKEEEFIPSRQELMEQKEKYKSLLRPILAIPLGYSKIYVYQEILHSKLTETIFAERYLDGYFPEIFHREFPNYLRSHRLKREIIATVISNKIVNQAGITFFSLMEEKTGKKTWQIARAYIIIENMIKADDFRNAVYELDNKTPSELQYKMLMGLEQVIFLLTEWMLLNLPGDRISFDMINIYQGVIVNFKKNLVSNLETVCSMEKGCLDEEVRKLTKQNIPVDLAENYAILPYLKDIMAILKIKEELHFNFIDTGNLYIKFNNYLCMDWIEETLEEIDTANDWEETAAENLYEELKDYQNRIVVKVLNFKRHEETIDECFVNFMKENEKSDLAFKEQVAKIRDNGETNLITLGVLVRSLKKFI